MPFLGVAQPGVFYPLHLLWILMPVSIGLGVVMVLKLWLAGLGMWGFLRAMSLHPSAAIVSSLGFMFSAWLVDWVTWPLSSVFVLLPWLAWSVYSWCRRGSRAALVWLAVLTAFAAFGGHPETQFKIILVTALWAVGLIVTSHRREWLRQVVGLGVAALLGTLVSAIQTLPFLEALGESRIGSLRPVDSLAAASYHLDAGMMLDWVLPRSWGHFSEGVLGGSVGFTEANGYIGLAALLGCVLALVGAAKRQVALKLLVPWVAIGGLAWILTYDGFLGTALRMLPVMNRMITVRWVAVAGFALLVISAFGWDWLARRTAISGGTLSLKGTLTKWTPRRLWRGGLLFGVGLLLLVEGLLLMGAHGAGLFPQPTPGEPIGLFVAVNDSYRFYWAVWALGVLLAASGAALLWWVPSRLRPVAPLVLAAVTVLDLWRLLFTVNGSAPIEQYYPETSFIRQVRELVPSPERFLVEGDGLPPNSAFVFGIRDWRAQEPMMSQRAYEAATFLSPNLPKNGWNEYNMFLWDVRLPVAPMLGMRYFVFPTTGSRFNPNVPDPPDPGRPTLTRLAFKDGLSLWRAEGVPGFAYLSDNVRAVGDEAEADEWMRAVTWEEVRDQAALVEAPPESVAMIVNDPAVANPGDVEVAEYSPGLVRLQVDAPEPALLVVAESLYPGWRGTLDGQPVEIVRANYLSQGVVVPSGSHTVELRYEPGAVRYGALLSLVGLGGVGGLAGWAGWPRFRRKRENE
jgi:hypothetical protein